VPAYPIEDFLPRNATIETQKYPKPGDANPSVHLAVVESNGGAVHWLSLPEQDHAQRNSLPNVGAPDDIYIPRFGWLSSGVLWVQVMNRAQNQLDLYFVETRSGKSRRVLSEKSDTWIQVSDDFHVLPVAAAGPSAAASSRNPATQAAKQFIWPSWRDGHTHLYLYSFNSQDPLGADARVERQLTHGDYEVTEVEAATSDVVYFLANKDDARQRQLYSVRWDSADPQVKQISQEHGTHETAFPDSLDPSRPPFYVDKYSALLVPHRLSLCQVGAACHAFWESRSVAGYALQAPQFLDFKAEDGTVLHGELFMPAQIAPGAKVPLIMNPYGGPQGQVVRDEWQGANSALFNQILARDGMATLQVDNRGMGGRGKKFASVVQRNFGETELRDQLAALQQALAANPQLDANRLGWWGWSYGGYMTLYGLTHSDKFVAGFAVAPVTDWHDYDSIYTERYMGLPQQNEAAYVKSSPVNFAGGLHGKLIIAHGTGDDNVHMQNTVQMTEALIAAGKPFDLMLYPRKTHSISGASDRIHLFRMIRDYFASELLNKK
jgi:dipeptidyl-peptidase 4